MRRFRPTSGFVLGLAMAGLGAPLLLGCTEEQQQAALDKLEEGKEAAQRKAGELKEGANEALDTASEGLQQAKETAQQYAPTASIEPIEGSEEAIVCDAGRCTVAAEFADEVRKDPTLITQGVTIFPRFGKNGVDGLYLASVPEGSVAFFMGLRTGDTVKSVAGEPLTSLDAAKKLSKKVNKKREVEVVYERQGSNTTIVLVLEQKK